MVGIHRIGGAPEFANVKRTVQRDRKAADSGTPARDDVHISREAQSAFEVARLIEETALQQDIRADRIAKAQEQIERGAYKVQEIVQRVAARIAGYVSA